MRTSMGLLALACLTLGVAPVLVLRVLSGAVNEFLGAAPDLSFDWSNIAAASAFGTIAPLWVAVILALLMLAAWVGLRVYGANFSRRYYETWGCGRAVQTADFEYTAAAFANPFKRVFAFLYRPVEETVGHARVCALCAINKGSHHTSQASARSGEKPHSERQPSFW